MSELINISTGMYRIIPNGYSYQISFKRIKARQDYDCAGKCGKKITKGTIKYSFSDGHAHLECATLYKYEQKDISHEYSPFPILKVIWVKVN